jgi:hypothetical protein
MIPVIIIHKGFSDYLNHTIAQANKNNFVYFISDNNPNINLPNFEYIDISTLSNGLEFFKKNYVHLNTTPYDYELFCYYRWIVLENFMVQRNLDVIFYIDSDVLLFVDVNEEWLKFNQYEMTLLHRTAAISSFITMNAITNFNNLLINIYTNRNSYPFKKIESHYKVRQECGLMGGVCDMTILEYFHYNTDSGGGPGRIGEMMIITNDSTYDHNINTKDQDFAFKNSTKEVTIIDKIPYVFNEKLNKLIKFNSLHFQGNSKHLISKIYDQCN